MLNRQFSDINPSSDNDHQLEELGFSADELLIKVRKPYTITKQRERWTEEEHEKFLEALKLYGRAWRRIQEHIGTKTAIQIRSHAQKFFSKVVRESGTEKSIEIPPPRPKKKPMHPYPRKLAHTFPKGIAIVKQHDNASSQFTSGSEQDSGSPVSVLSGVGSETVASIVSNRPNSCTLSLPSAVRSEPDETLLREQESGCYSHSTSDIENETMSSPGLSPNELKKYESPMELDSDNVSSEEISPPEGQSTCLKLFGKTVLVAESQKSSSSGGNPQCLSNGNKKNIVDLDMPTQLGSTFGTQNESIGIPKISSWGLWQNGISPLYYCLTPNYYAVNSEQSAITPVPVVWTFFSNLQVPVFEKPDTIMEKEKSEDVEASTDENAHKKGSFTGSKFDSAEGVGNDVCKTNLIDSQKYGVPNKPQCTFKLKPSENSAFTLVKASKCDCTAGFVRNNTDVDGMFKEG